ncbi:hypothetical protein NDU88_008720 [Pleurodeles waltl]|uniref:Uncharacterized protein n=1 Tax=Pleurodeles waltl TaxID=8319 RepID=A0AAV7RWX2_PLEWA|nr:hypothetical protein NDU88_008720 [Pleurodeles waltl]
MHDKSPVNTMDPLDDASNLNINDCVRESGLDNDAPIPSGVFPCVLSRDDTGDDSSRAVELNFDNIQGAGGSGDKENANDAIKEMVSFDNKRLRKPPKWLEDYVRSNV